MAINTELKPRPDREQTYCLIETYVRYRCPNMIDIPVYKCRLGHALGAHTVHRSKVIIIRPAMCLDLAGATALIEEGK